MNQRSLSYCPRCLTTSLIEHDGCSGKCLGCGAQLIRHSCANNGMASISQEFWLQAATAVSSVACPSCGKVARIAEEISQLPGLSNEAKLFWGAIAIGAVTVGLLAFLDKAFNSGRRA